MMRSPSPSTSVRSSRPLTKARRVNSPASAGRKPGTVLQARQGGGDHGAAAMDMELRYILAREARRPRKEQDQAAVDQLAPRIPEGSKGRPAWFRTRIDHRSENGPDRRPAQTDHGDPGWQAAASKARRLFRHSLSDRSPAP